MNWTRPVRLGGGQVQRNFGIRPDLITMPLPSLSSSAAVASTVAARRPKCSAPKLREEKIGSELKCGPTKDALPRLQAQPQMR